MAHCTWSRIDVSSEIESWLFLRLQALIYQMLNLKDLPCFDECIRLTTLAFLLNATECLSARISVRTLLPRLKSALIHANVSEPPFGDELRSWCLCTGAMIKQHSPEKTWFIAQLARFSPIVSAGPINYVQCRLEGYFYLPERQHSQLSGVISKVCSWNYADNVLQLNE